MCCCHIVRESWVGCRWWIVAFLCWCGPLVWLGKPWGAWVMSLSVTSLTSLIPWIPFVLPHITLSLHCLYCLHPTVWHPYLYQCPTVASLACVQALEGGNHRILWGARWISSEIGGYRKVGVRLVLPWSVCGLNPILWSRICGSKASASASVTE